MNFNIHYGLPFVTVTIQFRGKRLTLQKVLLDTGSAGTIFNSDVVGVIGVIPESEDVVDTIRGVGGVEYVYTKNFDAIYLDRVCLDNFQVEVGNMDYGMEIEGILGFDFIQTANLIIDTVRMEVYSENQKKN
ncbi:retropepsin-like domain-containing protein [Paenibacillus alba]|uniref:retropepsin-like aspartic protease n=1 Tax=Paenibacillus alba TaxID=1197127 RepID=UPI001566CA94|nr:retropepsin-like aspartic protease [Paenibacillus alba]NQX69666.1 retropepsin-like domain-containing protein [Paenibacillus alba]